MAKYEYNIELEAFRRTDKRGRPLYFNITEARRIQNMLEMGCSVPQIYNKIDFERDVSVTNLRTFIRNLNEGNLSLEGDYPAPVGVVKEIGTETKIQALEDRVKALEDEVFETKTEESKGYIPFWRKWR